MPERTPDCYWVLEDKLLAGEYAGAADPDRAREKLEALLETGVRSFVDLTEPGEYGLSPYEPIVQALAGERELDIRYRRMSIQDRGTPTIEHMQSVLEHIAAEIAGGRLVYVHCLGGIGRTGTVVGCWLVAQGVCGADDALQRIADLRADCRQSRTPSPETSAQREFITQWGPPDR